DVNFPIVAFNHEQIKNAVMGSFLTARKVTFPEIARRLDNLNPHALINVSAKLLAGGTFKPNNKDKKACFTLLDTLDHVGGQVQGSLSSKKYRRSELWSLMSFKGTPLWFITFSPADVKNPLCIYYANQDVKFTPNIPLTPQQRNMLIAQNPVATACFFHFMVQMFLRHILGVDGDDYRIYGKTDAYYGMVEQ
ncbi:hypothetical protein GALMADRAFT_44392, partial [Galerina marginata CBS 339.88]